MAEDRHLGTPYTSTERAWEYFMRGTQLYRRFTVQDNAQARTLFEQAIAADPKFARAYANLAATHRQDWILGWTRNYEESKDRAYENARKAVQLARSEPKPQPSLPHALEQLGYVELYAGRLEAASAAADEAVRHSPNYSDAYALAAHALIYQGKPEEALRKTQQAIDRDPKYPFFYDYHRGHAHYVWGFQTKANDPDASRRHFEEAEIHLRAAIKKSPNFRPARSFLVAVLSELGRQPEAVAEMATIRNLGGRPQSLRDPRQLEEFIKRTLPYKDGAITNRLIELWQAAESGS